MRVHVQWNNGYGMRVLIPGRTIDPVSYTHLDVYKRQILCRVDMQKFSQLYLFDVYSLAKVPLFFLTTP